jgi:hypothetical protein
MKITKSLRLLLLLTALFFAFPSALAAHYVVGQVDDALDSTSANNRVIVLWNPARGLADNITDIIGQAGNSGTDNVYFLDCEMLSNPCQIGNQINVKVFDSGDNYVTTIASLMVTGAGYDLMSTLRLNSPPSTSLNFPLDYDNVSSDVIFNCSSSDLDTNLANVTLYGNWSSGWHADETKTISGSILTTTFSKSISEGRYSWNCLSQDNLSISRYASANRTVIVDLTLPVISSFYTNLSGTLCGISYQTRVTCNATDALTGVKNVSIHAYSPSGINTSYNTQFVSPNSYYSDISLNEAGLWQFNCSVFDYADNLNTKNISLTIFSSSADLEIFSQNITFSNNLIEASPALITAMISNKGCSDANNFLVGFFNGQKETGTQLGQNQTGSIAAFSNASFQVTWYPDIGSTNIYAYADLSNIISEANETNNQANNTAFVLSWHAFYGNLTVEKILSDNSLASLSAWTNVTSYSGNIFVVDSDSSINWLSLQALGRDVLNQTTSNDFSDLDALLNTSSFNDSINKIYTDNTNTPLSTDSFNVFKKTIDNVPVINSASDSNFYTGLLWDVTKDTNNQFDTVNKEEIVLVTKINKKAIGTYGTYDYEIRVPARLRYYHTEDTSKVSFYYDLR